MKITALSTGTLQLKPTFLEGSPAHGGPLGLIWDLRRDRSLTAPLPMWSWIIETDSERIRTECREPLRRHVSGQLPRVLLCRPQGCGHVGKTGALLLYLGQELHV